MKPGEQILKRPLVVEESSIFLHSKETSVQMWNKVEEEMGIRVKVGCTYNDEGERGKKDKEEEGKGKGHFFQGREALLNYGVNVMRGAMSRLQHVASCMLS